MAQWIRRLSPEEEIPGSSPGRCTTSMAVQAHGCAGTADVRRDCYFALFYNKHLSSLCAVFPLCFYLRFQSIVFFFKFCNLISFDSML